MLQLNDSAANSTGEGWSVVLFNFSTILNGIFYGLIFVLGVIGNSAVCYIISCRLRQSATSIFLLNLSLADLLMALFCVPITFVSDCLLLHWVFGKTLCHVFPFIQGVCVFLSALTHTAISADRYYVVFHPLRRQNFPMKGAVGVVTCIWIFSVCASFPLVLVSHIKQSNGLEFCHENWSNNENEMTYSLLVMVFQYFLPIIVIVLTYSAIAIRIWFNQTPGESIQSRDEVIAQGKKKMIKMFIIVAVFYSLSQLPRHIIYIIYLYHSLQLPNNEPSFWNSTTVPIMNVTHLLSMSACFYNPILYVWLNSSFRKSLTKIFTCRRDSSLPPTSPKCLNAFPDTQSCRQIKLSVSSNNALFVTKVHRRFL